MEQNRQLMVHGRCFFSPLSSTLREDASPKFNPLGRIGGTVSVPYFPNGSFCLGKPAVKSGFSTDVWLIIHVHVDQRVAVLCMLEGMCSRP